MNLYPPLSFSLCYIRHIFLLLFLLQAASSAGCPPPAQAFPPSPLGPLQPFLLPIQPHRFRPDFPSSANPAVNGPWLFARCPRKFASSISSSALRSPSPPASVVPSVPLLSSTPPPSSVSFFPQWNIINVVVADTICEALDRSTAPGATAFKSGECSGPPGTRWKRWRPSLSEVGVSWRPQPLSKTCPRAPSTCRVWC